MTFGEKIQKLRKESGLSQEELSYQLGVSRQAISKWERDNGYPETDKIVRMSKIFHVTLDYLLNEEEAAEKTAVPPDESGIYVSLETAEGFLCYQKAKVTKTGIAVGLYIGSLALPLWNPELGILIFIVLMIAATVLLFSVKLNDNPYRRLWKEPLLFDKNTKAKLTSAYTDWRKRANLCILTGITFIAAGILFFPLIIPASYEFLDTLVIGCGILLAALGAFLCIAAGGIMRAYRLLIMNETYQEKKKVRI